ncbi:MAG: hypothetical protein ACRDJN_18115 [Chloroflexota bacterium]
MEKIGVVARKRFGVHQRPDGRWEAVDRQTGLAGVGGTTMPVKVAAAGYAAWLNREEAQGTLAPDYQTTRGRPPRALPPGATGPQIGAIWRSRLRRGARRVRGERQ